MISVPAPLDKYGTRTRPHICAGISIRVIHGYLDTNGYPRVPMDFFFFVQKKIQLLITCKIQLLKIHT